MAVTRSLLKHYALSNSLLPKTSLKEVLQKQKFVQIDPISSPAPAHDLILRQRVKNYHVGDIDRAYAALRLEEDYLYAHGYMTHELWTLLHPRSHIVLTAFDKEVYSITKNFETVDDKTLDEYFHAERETNWWGGMSKATSMSLNRLHEYGLIRIIGRKEGKRVYAVFLPEEHSLSIEERVRQLILTIVAIHQPISQKMLQETLHRTKERFGDTSNVLNHLLADESLIRSSIDNINYYWLPESAIMKEVNLGVRILAPFDPVVRDRTRFAYFWGWEYRFEAYIPVNKRIRGYYAMPILWNTEVIGWANLKVNKKELQVDLGFVHGRPKDTIFKNELEKEINGFKLFLGTE